MIDFEIIDWPEHVFDPESFVPVEPKTAWKYKHGDVYFLLSRRGESLECHIGATGKAGKYKLAQAGYRWLEQVPEHYPWCKMLLAPVRTRSVYNYCRRMGFQDAGATRYGDGLCRLMFVRFEKWAEQ